MVFNHRGISIGDSCFQPLGFQVIDLYNNDATQSLKINMSLTAIEINTSLQFIQKVKTDSQTQPKYYNTLVTHIYSTVQTFLAGVKK